MDKLQRRKYKQDEISHRIKEIFTYYDNYRKQFEEKAIENYKTFIGYKEELKNKSKSNLHIPKTYEILDTIRARFLSSFFDQRPYVEFTPMPEGGGVESVMVNEDKAKVAASFVDEQLEKNDIKSVFYDFVTSMLIFPASFLSVGWRYETANIKRKTKQPLLDQYGSYSGNYTWDIVESEEVIWDDNEVNNVDFFDFWGDPDNTDIDEARAVFHREFTTIEKLREKLELLDVVGDGIVYPIDFKKIQSYSREKEKGRYKRLSAIGISNFSQDPFKSKRDGKYNPKEEVELLHYWEDNRHTILLNREKVIYDGANPYWRHRKKPFIKASYDRLPNEFYGMSAVDIIKHMQEELNTMHNQRIDNVSMLINRMWKRLKGSDVDEEQLVSRPNGVIDVNNMEDIMPIDMPDIPRSAFISEDKLEQDIQKALGTPANIRGAHADKTQTATEASITAESAGTRFGTKIEIFKEKGIKRMAMMMDLNNQQFICDKRATRINPEERNSWQTVKPGDLIGEFDYRPATSSVEAAANKELRREQLTQIIGFLMQAQVPFVNYQRLIKEWLREFDIDHPEKFLIPQEQYAVLKRQAIEEYTQQMGVPAQEGMAHSQNGNLGRSQIKRPQRSAGGIASDGQPKPQPGMRGGTN